MCKYIIPIHGLSNRINWFAGLYCFNFINPCIFNKEKCVVYMKWTPDKECDGKFEDIFRILPNLILVSNDEEVPKEIPVYRGQFPIPNIYSKFNIKIDHNTECLIYGFLKFKNEIENISQEFIKNNFSQKTIGLHIRRTDGVNGAKYFGNFTSDAFFMKIIDVELAINKDTKFFLATDNADTQLFFKNKYPNNIIFFKQIDKKDILRQTTLKEAGIDLCILSYCHHIEGSFHSAFTRAAILFNLNRRKEIDKANEELNKYFYRGKNEEYYNPLVKL